MDEYDQQRVQYVSLSPIYSNQGLIFEANERKSKNELKEAFTRTGAHNLSGYTRKEYYLTRVAREGYEGQLTVQAKLNKNT